MSTPVQIKVLVDADACPVKDEIYRVASRHAVHVSIVANSFMRVPQDRMIERVVVGAGFDAADDWIAERAGVATIVVTGDIPLADRCLRAGAVVIAHNGKPFTPDSIGMALAMRNLHQDLRATGEVSGGPAAFAPRDRSAFLSSFDQAVRRLARG